MHTCVVEMACNTIQGLKKSLFFSPSEIIQARYQYKKQSELVFYTTA
jgi:hypothetical protein